MPQLSDAPEVSRFPGREKHVPFSCFLEASVFPGKRFARVRDFEEQHADLETVLESVCSSSDDPVFDFTKPVAYTRQFGDKPPRFSFHGHLCVRTDFPKLPHGERQVISAGVILTGPSTNRATLTPPAELDTIVKDFRALLEAATGLPVIRLEVARVIYGQGGFHLPR